ncbi:MAG: phosphoglycerate kinase [bacterium]|nr:phosphoglycerate kinase [bacterium]
MKSVRSIKNLRGKVALLRSDLNVESVKDSFKLSRAIPTISYLKKKGAITIVMSHRGRPFFAKASKGEPAFNATFSLKPLVPYLSRKLGKVTFIPSHSLESLNRAIKGVHPGAVLLLENVRFNKGEDLCDLKWARLLASVANIYINDAFASHHPGATVSVLPKLLPSYIGLQMESEIRALSAVMRNPKKPLVVILAGGKAADKFAVIESLHRQTTTFLVGGILANTFFKAMGMTIDSSIYDQKILSSVKKMLHDPKIVLPMDWISNTSGKILDLGLLSANRFAKVIAGAGTVIWNGPMGYFEDPRFKPGSVAIARAIAKSKALSVVGGGETTSLILDLGLQNKIDFLSTGGGAMLAFLAGKKHAGLDALGHKS